MSNNTPIHADLHIQFGLCTFSRLLQNNSIFVISVINLIYDVSVAATTISIIYGTVNRTCTVGRAQKDIVIVLRGVRVVIF